MTQSNDRLDRIEAILERLAERQDQFQVQLEQQNGELEREFEFVGTSLSRLERQVSRLERQVSEISNRVDMVAVRVDESVRQAALDRQVFARSVEQMIDILTRQFGSNGHGA